MKKLMHAVSLCLSLILILSLAAPTAWAFGQEDTNDFAKAPALENCAYGTADAAHSDIGTIRPELPQRGTYVEGELLVKLRQSFSLQSIDGVFADYASDCEFLFSVEDEAQSFRLMSEDSGYSNWYRLTLRDGADMLSAWQSIAAIDNVEIVEPNYICNAAATTASIMDTDPYIHAQTWLDRIRAVDAWENDTYIGTGIVVAVVDSGVDLDHPDLAPNLYKVDDQLVGKDFVNGTFSPDDKNGHGTHVAGIIAACNNDIGVRGVACGAKIMPVRVLDADGSGSNAATISGICFAADNGADIINMSLGGIGERSSAEEDAVRYARSKGCLVVAAAGNSNLPTYLPENETYGGVYCSPADIPGVLTVMAADENGTLASFSNYDNDPGAGYEYEIMAPGVNILSTFMDGGYGYLNGTSMACPVVAGAAAVLMGMGCDADSAFQIIASCAKTDAGRVEYSYPSLDLRACVEKAQASTVCNAEPIVANCSVSAGLSSLDFGHGDVDFSAMNTRSRLYFYDGVMMSDLSFAFENIGGSGDVTITGTVGGCPVTEQTYSVKLGGGEAGSLMQGDVAADGNLEVTGTPSVDSNGDVEISLYANGTLVFYGWIPAFELKTLPADSFLYSYTNVDGIDQWVAEMNTASLTLSGSPDIGTVWVLDAITLVPAGSALNVTWQSGQKNCLVYAGSGKYMKTGFDSTSDEYGTILFSGVSLLGETGFSAMNSGGPYSILMTGCYVYDPYILGIRYASETSFYDNGYANRMLQGNSLYLSGFYNCDGLVIRCNYLWGNMINNCKGSRITAAFGIYNNTFVENFGKEAGSALRCNVPNYNAAKGFYDNCVIGPMKVYAISDDGYITGTLAEIGSTYHQRVGTTDAMGNNVIPPDVTDRVYCSEASTVTEDEATLKNWGLNLCCPAFVTSMETRSYGIDPGNGSAINYSLRFHFSAPVALPALASFSSETDAMTGTATMTLSQYGYYCDVNGTTVNQGLATYHFYCLSGYYQSSIQINDESWAGWATAMGKQSLYQYPVRFEDFYYDSRVDTFSIDGDGDSRTLTWSDDRLTSDHCAEIRRSVNGGFYDTIAEAISGNTYTDPEEYPAGTELSYSIWLTASGGKSFSGTDSFLVAYPPSDMGVELCSGPFTSASAYQLTAQLTCRWRVSDCLSITFPGVQADAVSFCNAVKDSGIAYGAVSDASGTTVYLGANDRAYLPAGEPLFTLTVSADDTSAEITPGAKTGNTALGWEKNDICSYRVFGDLGRLVRTTSDTNAQLWCGTSGKVILATYNTEGRMTLNDIAPQGSSAIAIPASGKVNVFFLDSDYQPLYDAAVLNSQ